MQSVLRRLSLGWFHYPNRVQFHLQKFNYKNACFVEICCPLGTEICFYFYHFIVGIVALFHTCGVRGGGGDRCMWGVWAEAMEQSWMSLSEMPSAFFEMGVCLWPGFTNELAGQWALGIVLSLWSQLGLQEHTMTCLFFFNMGSKYLNLGLHTCMASHLPSSLMVAF